MSKHLKKLLCSTAILLISMTQLQAQSPKSVEKPVARLNEYNGRLPVEKVYLHTDRKHYAPGESIWFQAYVVAGYFHEPSPLSNNVYVTLHASDKSVIDQQLVRSDIGAGHGVMDLPQDLASGSYVLRAYTNWMKNFDESYFFEKELVVIGTEVNPEAPNTNLDIDLQFFPEGGHLIAQVASRIAFKAIDNNGQGMEVSGTIYDDTDKEITKFNTAHEGMGMLVLTPEKGRSYRAEVEGRDFPYELPKVENQGYGIAANNNLKDVLRLTFRSNEATKKRGKLGVVIHTRGAVSFAFEVDVEKNIAFVNLPKNKLPAGINHVTLFSPNGQPLLERLVFVEGAQESVTLSTDKTDYEKREKVTANLEVKDSEGNPVTGVFSLAAIDLTQSVDAAPEATILSNLLLTSDLHGHIANPMYYFSAENVEAKKHLDLVMMTHGWSRFKWNQLAEKLQQAPEYMIEQGLNVSGRLVRIQSDKPAPGGQVTLVNQASSPPMLLQAQTDKDGRFTFEKVILFDNEEIIFQGTNRKGRNLVDIQMDTLLPSPLVTQFAIPLQSEQSALIDITEFNEKKKYRDQIEAAYNFDSTATLLETVVVEGSRIAAKEEEERESIFGKGDNTVRFEGQDVIAANNPLEMLQGKVAGVVVTGSGAQTSVVIRGAQTGAGASLAPLILIDDVPTDVANITSLPANLIERVEVFKGASASIFGVRGAGGVLAFYTKKGANMTSNRGGEGVLNTRLKNTYRQGRDFYAPKYDVKIPEHIKPDSRIVLFWQPTITLDEKGQAKVEFWNSDEVTEVLIDLQGITKAGTPLAITTTYKINK